MYITRCVIWMSVFPPDRQLKCATSPASAASRTGVETAEILQTSMAAGHRCYLARVEWVYDIINLYIYMLYIYIYWESLWWYSFKMYNHWHAGKMEMMLSREVYHCFFGSWCREVCSAAKPKPRVSKPFLHRAKLLGCCHIWVSRTNSLEIEATVFSW